MWGEGEVAGSQPMHITWHGAQINFGDLPPYLTYDLSVLLPCPGYLDTMVNNIFQVRQREGKLHSAQDLEAKVEEKLERAARVRFYTIHNPRGPGSDISFKCGSRSGSCS
jgi:hypothetical protein